VAEQIFPRRLCCVHAAAVIIVITQPDVISSAVARCQNRSA
jgi:hypothetical protein